MDRLATTEDEVQERGSDDDDKGGEADDGDVPEEERMDVKR